VTAADRAVAQQRYAISGAIKSRESQIFELRQPAQFAKPREPRELLWSQESNLLDSLAGVFPLHHDPSLTGRWLTRGGKTAVPIPRASISRLEPGSLSREQPSFPAIFSTTFLPTPNLPALPISNELQGSQDIWIFGLSARDHLADSSSVEVAPRCTEPVHKTGQFIPRSPVGGDPVN